MLALIWLGNNAGHKSPVRAGGNSAGDLDERMARQDGWG